MLLLDNGQAVTTYTINDISFSDLMHDILDGDGYRWWDHGTCQAYLVG